LFTFIFIIAIFPIIVKNKESCKSGIFACGGALFQQISFKKKKAKKNVIGGYKQKIILKNCFIFSIKILIAKNNYYF